MKKSLLTFSLLVLFFAGFSANWINITSPVPVEAKILIKPSATDQSVVQFHLDGFHLNPVKTEKGNAFVVQLPKATPVEVSGAPDLPKLTASLMIPDLGAMEIRVISSSYKDFPDLEIAPSKGVLSRTTDPSTIPFTFGKAYSKDAFFPGTMADSRTPYILRDFRGQTFLVYPFQYNPVTKVLRVYYDLTVEVVKVSDKGINPLIRKQQKITVSKEFDALYERHFLNKGVSSYTPVNDYGKLLVICYGPFMDAIRPYVNWKNSIGFPTKLVDVAAIGNTSAAIKTYIAGYYATNNLAFVLLVGDGAQIPTNQGSDVGGPSDNAYGYLVGNDHYADVFVGRFSAENVSQVQTQVTRTINYEKSPAFPTDDWYKTVLGIGSDQGPGDDNEMDFEHIRNQQSQLLAYTYSNNPELFDGSQGGNDASGSPVPADVSSVVNEGAGLILYTGHGSGTSWGTTGFSNTNVNALTNQGKLPFIWSVACVNGDFVSGTCFAEAWLRASQGGQPTGAMAFLGSTINQSWNSPMCGQDEMTDILAESYSNNIKRTFAGISLNGCMKMIDEYGTDGENMADTWTVFGDPTLQVRTSLPENLTVTHDATLFVGSTTLHVTCTVDGARATATLNDSLLATGIVVNHSVNLTFPALPAPNDSVHLVVTGYNHIPFISDIPIITPNGPYIMYTDNHINDTTGNNNHMADYDEDLLLTLYLKNVGVIQTTNLDAHLRTSDPYVNLMDTTENYGVVDPGQVKSVVDGYSLHISNHIPDGHPISLTLVSVDGTSLWNSPFTITGHAPVLNCGMVSVIDSTGNNNRRLDPGETAFLKIFVRNTGSAGALNVSATLVGINPFVTILGDQQDYGDLAGGTSGWRIFQVHVDDLAPEGQTAPFLLEISAEKGITGSGNFNLVIGQIPVLIVDLDGNQSSGPAMRSSAQELGIMTNYTTLVDADSLRQYASIFVCLGVFPNNTALTSLQGQWLASYLNQGGHLYMEGGDTWYFDDQTAVHPLFHITPVEDGYGDLTTISGVSATLSNGMSFEYTGENQYIDRLMPADQSFAIFNNSDPAYSNAIAYDAGTYKTIGTSFEFAGLSEGAFPSTRQNLMKEYLDFFGIQAPPLQANFVGFPTTVTCGNTVAFSDFSTGGVNAWNWNFPGGTPSSSTEKNPVVTYNSPGSYDVTLTANNGSGDNTLIRNGYIHADYATAIHNQASLNCSLYPNPCNDFIHLNLSSGKSDCIDLSLYNPHGTLVYSESGIVSTGEVSRMIDVRRIPEGLYFLRITGKNGSVVRKIIVQK
jgi:PKD repeat protein